LSGVAARPTFAYQPDVAFDLHDHADPPARVAGIQPFRGLANEIVLGVDAAVGTLQLGSYAAIADEHCTQHRWHRRLLADANGPYFLSLLAEQTPDVTLFAAE
jgi:hypothetical protein